MLMWDGGLIKVVLTRANLKPCHEGGILTLMHDRATNVILSGGADGECGEVWGGRQTQGGSVKGGVARSF